MHHGRIQLETTGDVAVMTLNDPSVLNAFGRKLREDMTAAMDRIEAGSARCLVINRPLEGSARRVTPPDTC